MKLGELDLDEAATKVAGNWRHFNCFVWFRDRDLDDAQYPHEPSPKSLSHF